MAKPKRERPEYSNPTRGSAAYAAELVERERCAKVCEAMADSLDWSHSCDEFIEEALRACAAAIREGNDGQTQA